MADLSISAIEIVPVKPQSGLVAFASCIINSQFYVGNIGIHTTLDGEYRLVYPTKKLNNGTHIKLFHPINRECGEQIESAISAAYQSLLSSAS